MHSPLLLYSISDSEGQRLKNAGLHCQSRAELTDFIDFARSEGRFSKHFDRNGNPSETLLRARQDRLENWYLLQELAGLR
jgi:pyruvate ferredoxin oxidoreductase beta subunit